MTGPAPRTPDDRPADAAHTPAHPAAHNHATGPTPTRRHHRRPAPDNDGRHEQGHHDGARLTDDQRDRLTALINSAPPPPSHVLTRLRGYLPPTTPD